MATRSVVVQAQQVYGQSFMCMTMPASELDKVAEMANVSLLLQKFKFSALHCTAKMMLCMHSMNDSLIC